MLHMSLSEEAYNYAGFQNRQDIQQRSTIIAAFCQHAIIHIAA
jgi:hypothetical protein